MSEDGGSSTSNPGVDGVETPEQAPMQRDASDPIQQEPSSQPTTTSDDSPLSGVMPDDSDSDGDGRTGVLSTYVEVHALVLGVSAGAIAAQSGRLDEIGAIIGAGAAGSRAQLGLPEKYQDQARKELPYFIAGAAIGYAGGRGDMLAGLHLGV